MHDQGQITSRPPNMRAKKRPTPIRDWVGAFLIVFVAGPLEHLARAIPRWFFRSARFRSESEIERQRPRKMKRARVKTMKTRSPLHW